MIALRLGIRAPLHSRHPSGLTLPLATTLLVCAFTSLVTRALFPLQAADHALAQNFGLWFPLCAYGLFHKVAQGGRLEFAVYSVLRHAGSRRQAVGGAALTLGGILALTGASVAALSVALTHPTNDAAFARDILLSSWVGALAGFAYAAWLSLASVFGRRGRRGAFLILDLIFGSSASAWSLPFPRAHVRNLLGGRAPAELAQSVSSAILLLGSLLILGLMLLRTPD